MHHLGFFCLLAFIQIKQLKVAGNNWIGERELKLETNGLCCSCYCKLTMHEWLYLSHFLAVYCFMCEHLFTVSLADESRNAQEGSTIKVTIVHMVFWKTCLVNFTLDLQNYFEMSCMTNSIIILQCRQRSSE